jgi:SAM-dependent methyltransferase
MDDNGKIFDRAAYRIRRARAAATWPQYDFLKHEAAERLGECLDDLARTFPVALDLGCHAGEVKDMLAARSGTQRIVSCDLSRRFAPQIVCDEELLPFAENTFDLAVSALSLHHVNDLPGALIQIRRALKPGGLFLAILPGANTLKELRLCVIHASAEQGFALSPRISPFVEVRDAGALLVRAGFTLPVADSDTLEVRYTDAFKLMNDLRGMGESNVLEARQRSLTPRGQLAAIAEYYQSHFVAQDGTLPATFEFITMTGWKP